MNYLFAGILVFSIVSAFFGGNADGVTQAVLSGGSKAVEYAATAGAAIVVYSGIMKVAERAGLGLWLSRRLSPLIERLFGKLPAGVREDITMNVSCNFLGLGNAATPYGIRAMQAMAQGDRATDGMILFAVINSSSIQFLPTTLAAVRQSAGCASPFDILPCVWICSALSLAAAVTACFVCRKAGGWIAKLHNAGGDTYNRSRRADKAGKRV